ncbi:Non-repetitive/WGA-negative nucleoporin C-terminal-domain-containing protein [Phaeosphaeria sp. MPI-PUGE-AT-0046c]|nr:Non-repetitive/WGA-negative nucleoporin C-terminal-domain-containing protein [Phaeosphaeria sp. MPI-PUGE-AT-0046c]
MFSPEASIQSARSSLRNPRRRPRESDGPQHQSRRKRSKISDDSFVAKDEAHVNGNGTAPMNGHGGVNGSAENSMVVIDMPVREKKSASKRIAKEDHSLYLTRNSNYSVKKLPGFPNVLLRTPYRATALSSAGLALALTHDRALVWDYAAESTPKIVSLSLPFGLRPSDPLPLGQVVRNGPTNDFGIVAVAPSSGKIAFWENIDSAEARNLYPQRHQGAEGYVKLYSGETIADVVDIEHAGFILITSSGRLAHLTLRDSQGRPSITATVLSAPSSSNGGFFSLKGLLGGAIRKNIASVKARASDAKGQMEVISVTSTGLFQQWDLSWSGQHNFIREVDTQAAIASAVQGDTAPESRNLQDVQVLDFAIIEQQRSQEDVSLLLLVALSGSESLRYSLLEADLSSSGVTVSRAIPLDNFHQPQLPQEPSGTLLLPYPGHTAFVQFPGAVCVASLAQQEESPDNQLLLDSGRPALPFQDTVYFREEPSVTFAGHALEEANRKEKRARALLFVQGYGVLQINISSGILNSSYPYLDKVTSSLDDQFKKRASALRTLIDSLRSDYPPLAYETKWRLLWQAEKLAAAHKLWLWYQERQQDQQLHPESNPDKLIMGDIIRAVNERFKTPIQSDLGETDFIRQFFIRDVESIHVLIPWGWFYLRTFYIKEGGKEQPPIMQRLSEGNDVMLVTLETAFEFRQANIEAYDLDPDSLEDGVLRPEHGNDILPHFWTSSHNIVSSVRSLVDVGRNLAVSNYEEGYQEVLAQKIGKDNPRLVKVCCQTHIERFQWALEQSEEKQRETGRSLKNEWNTKVRPSHILGLMEIGLPTEGMKLAEQYHDMPTLVDLVWEETDWLESEKATTRSKMEQAESTVKLNRIKERISRYFETYGDDWAEAFYSKYINENQAAQLFKKEYLNQAALTNFLRADPSRARLGWINEVIGERNYEAAAASLYNAASNQETNAWCQRVEFSLAKLAMLCKDETKASEANSQSAIVSKQMNKDEKARQQQYSSTLRQLSYSKIQEDVYEQLLPIITGALDDDSAIELLMAEFGQGHLRERPAHQAVLKEGFENLIHHKVIDPALMIDILTLMDSDDKDAPTLMGGQEFLYAIRVLMLNWHDIHRTARDGLLKVVWKRLCIRDDWAQINQTKDISDAQLEDFLVGTNLAWVFQGILHMRGKPHPNTYPSLKIGTPRDVPGIVGGGTTHGELCVRFASEDLREPIIHDNLLDDDILSEYFQKHRFDEWYVAASQAGRRAYDAAKQQSLLQTADMDVKVEDDSGADEGEEQGGDDDVEMEDS